DAFRPIAPLMAADLVSAEADDAEFERFDALSISDYLASLSDVDPTLRSLLELAYVGEYGLEAGDQSCLNLLYLIDHETPDPFRIYGDSDERFHVRGGNDQIPAALAMQLADRISLEHRLLRISEAGQAYRLTFDRGGASVEHEADFVVLALPFTTLRQVEINLPFSEDKLDAIENLGYGTNAKLIAGFDERVWRTQHGSTGSAYVEDLQTLWDTSRK